VIAYSIKIIISSTQYLLFITIYFDIYLYIGDIGLLGITVEGEYGGSSMDAVAAVIAHGECFMQRTLSSCFYR
jgi:alkylation response protein AidB-like acyl-CoA dehydrogenase